MSPTQRSLSKLRAEGWLVAIVERWNAYARVRQDLFGFADILAIKGGITLAIQVTSGSNVANRLRKIRANPAASVWINPPHRQIVVHGWAKRGPRGRSKKWQCRIVTLDSLDTTLTDPQTEMRDPTHEEGIKRND